MSAGGTIGIAKGSATVLGHLNFTRDVKKPVVHRLLDTADTGSILLIEDLPPKQHLQYAQTQGIPFHNQLNQAVYEVPIKSIKNGLKKAIRLGGFFGKHSSRQVKEGWRVYELKAGFDFSISGKLALVGIVGLATTEISFYNQNF